MISNHFFTARILVIAGMALSVGMIPGKETVIPSSAPPASSQTVLVGDSRGGRALSRAELLPLEAVAGRVQSMMSEIAFTFTRVWPHGVRDEQGRIGIFLSSERPLFNDPTPAIVQAKEDWVVIGLVAAVKYAEGSQIRHIAFTDSRGETGERWYYDLSMAEAREIHGLMIRGVLHPENAYRVIEARWQKVTPQQKYTMN